MISTSVFTRLLTQGYFPRELPPTFSTTSFGNAAATSWNTLYGLFRSVKQHALVTHHSLPRSGFLRRDLGIVNPVMFGQLAFEIANEWPNINHRIQRSVWSKSTPVLDTRNFRAFTPSSGPADLVVPKSRMRVAKKVLLKTDISRFYNSIYTHSVPWAFHGKSIAKQNRSPGLAGNRIDRALRKCADGQTIGIAIGPDTSLIVAELILSDIDAALQATQSNLLGLRYIDDYEIVAETRGMAEDIISSLQELLSDFELEPNATKTKILDLPIALEDAWVDDLRSLPLRLNSKAQHTDLVRLFDRAIEYARRNSGSLVMRFFIGRLRQSNIDKANWDLCQLLLAQCILQESGTIQHALSLVLEYKQRAYIPGRDILEPTLNFAIREQCRLGHTNEVSWAVWGLMTLNYQLDTLTISALENVGDPVVTLLVLHAERLGICQRSLNPVLWSSMMTATELYGEWWLLAYEAAVRGWLTPVAGHNYVKADPAFASLAAMNVRFYDDKAIGILPAVVALKAGLSATSY
jgi:hypothetical protein